MAKLGEKYFEIGRGYEFVSPNYKRPYIIGVDIKETTKPFVLASGDNHSDSGAIAVSVEELLSGKWKDHISKSNCTEFVDSLKQALDSGESFPPMFLQKDVNKE
jgi:hypothetical protein